MKAHDPVIIIREDKPAVISEVNRQWYTVEVDGEFYGCYTANELKPMESEDE